MLLEFLLSSILSKTTPKAEVYWIQNTVTKNVKNGKTGYKNTAARLAQLQTGADARLIVVRTQPTMTHKQAFALERELHKRNKQHHVRGEWYKDDILR